jgi:hypothetical protein
MSRIEGYLVRMKGLEPPCLAALDPKSSASTSSATSADKIINLFLALNKFTFLYLIYTAIAMQIPFIRSGWKNGMQK